MKIQRIERSDLVCDDCAKEYPDCPLNVTTIIDGRYLCNVHADEEINMDLYDNIDKEYNYIDTDE